MISIQSITRQDLQYSYCAAIFVVLMCDEANESFGIVLTASRCHFDELVGDFILPEVSHRSLFLPTAF